MQALPDGGYGRGERRLLAGDDRSQRGRLEEAVGHDQRSTDHECGVGKSPRHGVELRHHGECTIALREVGAVAHADLHGVQVDRTVGVDDALGVTRGAGRVTHCGSAQFVDLGPVELGGLIGDQALVGVNLHSLGSFESCSGGAGDDDVFDGGQRRKLRREKRNQGRVDDDHAVLGVIGDMDQLLGEQTNVQGVEHSAHRGDRQVRLEVLGVVPHERGDSLVALDAEPAQGVRELSTALADVSVGHTARAGLGPRDNLGGAVNGGTVAEKLSNGEGGVLHGAQHGLLLCGV